MATMEELAGALRAKALVEKLLAVLRHADASINPPDRDGISLDKWNGRLKSATVEIRDGIVAAEDFLKAGASYTVG